MMVIAALLVYDFVLTIVDEVDFIWRQKLSVASAIFITNRVAVLLVVIFLILGEMNNVRHTVHINNCRLKLS